MYLYRTVISTWSHDPSTYNKFITKGITLRDFKKPIDYAVQLTGYELGWIIEFVDAESQPAQGGVLKAVMHDEKGVWLHYKEQSPPRFIEHAHYVKPDTAIKVVPQE